MITLINTWAIRLFCVFWMLFLFLDYANNSGYLTQAFTYFKYTGLLVTIIIFSGLLTYIFVKRKGKGQIVEVKHFRNIYSYLILLLFMALIMLFYINQTEITKSSGSAIIMFIVKTAGFHLALLPVLAAAYGSGSFLINKSGLTLSHSGNFFISLATGFAVITLCLFLFGVVGFLTQPVVFILIGLLIIPGWKNVVDFFRTRLFAKIPAFEIHFASIIPYGLILFFMALNFCYTTRPFPIGFDDLNLYMNTPKLIAGYAGLTQGGDAYNWSLVMSLGFVMYKSATIAILLSVLPGILGLMVLYRISRLLNLSRDWSLFACAVYYTLPNIIWQSRNDAKVDLAMMFITLCAVLLLMEFYFLFRDKSKTIKISKLEINSEYTLWMICGVLVGFAFGIKYTSMLSVFAFLVYIFYITAGRWAAVGMFFLNFVLIFGLRLTRFAAFEAESIFLAITPLILAVIFFAISMKKNPAVLLQPVKLTLIFGFFIGLTFIPWAIKHSIENKSVSFNSLLTGKSPLPVLYPDMAGSSGISSNDNLKSKQLVYDPANESLINLASLGFNNIVGTVKSSYRLLADNSSDKKGSDDTKDNISNKTEYTDKYEEIRRYLGYEKGVIRFISLPYDLAMKTNVRLWSADTGILFLILFPFFMLVYKGNHLGYNLLKMALMIMILIACMLSVQMFSAPFDLQKTISALEAGVFTDAEKFIWLTPVYVTLKKLLLTAGNAMMPVYKLLTVQTLGLSFMLVMLSSGLFYLLFADTLSRFDKKSKAIIAFTFCVLITWMILSSGIFWYGMAGFAMLSLVITLLIQERIKNTQSSDVFSRYIIPVCFGLWMILIIPFQFMPIRFTLVKDMTQVDFNSFIDQPFAKYATGISNEKEVYRQFFQPAEQQIMSIINNNRQAGVLNVSTFLTYHITDNDRRVYTDNQLGVFNRIYTEADGDKQKIVAELKAKGIKYVLVSLHTPTLDMTPEKSLSKKFSNMMQTLLNNPGSRLLFTNRVVERPDGNMNWTVEGKQVKAMNHLAGVRMLSPGSVAMFEIL